MYYGTELALKNFLPLLDLFDDLNDRINLFTSFDKKQTKNIPLNVYRDGNNYVYEFVVPGFSRESLEVSVDENNLYVKGNRMKNNEENDVKMNLKEDMVLFRIPDSFEKKYTINPDYEISDVLYNDGLLRIHLRKKKRDTVKINIK
jgi:HSP20 family molecular chaperone IbpA